MIKKTHGGKRPGAGPKPGPEGNRLPVLFTLEKSAIESLKKAAKKQKKSRSSLVNSFCKSL